MSTTPPHFVEIPTKSLIDLVKMRPALYDKNIPEYTNADIKRRCWAEIGERLFRSHWNKWSKSDKREATACIMKRWGNLRTTYARELKKRIRMKKQGLSCANEKKYKHTDRLKFVTDFLILQLDGETKPAKEFFQNLDELEFGKDEDDPNEEEEEDEEEKSEEQYLDEPMVEEYIDNEKDSDCEYEYLDATIEQPKKRIKVEQYEVPIDPLVMKNKNLNKKSRKSNNEEESSGVDQDVNFAMSLVPMLKELPLNVKLQAQIEILKIFRKLSE